MRIERIEITGFGCLAREELHFEPGRANLILADNEAGKSTLLAAIETALYGFPPRSRAAGRELRQRFRPWGGGPSRLALDLHDGAHRYRIEQELLDPSGELVERLTIHRDHEDVTDVLRGEADSPGDWLLRLSRDDFRRSVLVHQGELERVAEDTEGLVGQLDSVVTSAEAGASAAAALERLDAAVEEYRDRAGLEPWSESHLAHARQWPRVEARLQEQIATYEQQRRKLEQRREELANEIAELEGQESRLAELHKARECLHLLELSAQRRDIRRRLDGDDDLSRQIAEVEKGIAGLEDVRGFPAEESDELTRLLERDAQLRQQMRSAAEECSRLAREIADIESQRAELIAVAALAGRVDELHAALVLFRQSIEAERAAKEQWAEAIRTLEAGGTPPEQLQEARQRYHLLSIDERRMVKDVDRHELTFVQQRREAEQSRQEAQAQLRVVDARRRLRRRQGLLLGACGAAVGVVVGFALGWGLGAGMALAVFAACVPALASAVIGAWVVTTAAHIESYRYDQLQDQLRRLGEDELQLERERHERGARLDELAARHALPREALLAAVDFYLLHREQLDIVERMDELRTKAREELAAHRRRWAEWLRKADPERAVDDVSIEAAEALVARAQRFNELQVRMAQLDAQRRGAEQSRDGLLRSAGEAEASIADILRSGGVELSLPPRRDQLAPAEELVVARREFARRSVRRAERARLVVRLEELRQRRLPAEERAALEQRRARLDEDLTGAGEGAMSPEAALAWLRTDFDAGEDAALASWSLHVLAAEEVTRVRARVSQRIEWMRSARGSAWQEARGFLKDYTRCMQEIDGTLCRLRAELARGRQFAEAIGLARDTLTAVAANSCERWGALLTRHLCPLLGAFLPGYVLEGIGSDLAPRLLHTPTAQRLDLDAIRLHLSRGAKDRLFLAIRLALARVLGEERGVRLPLLLDDPLANWDDAALAAGLRTLAEFGQRESSLIILSCQRSRCERVVRELQTGPAQVAVRTFGARTAGTVVGGPKTRAAAEVAAPETAPPKPRSPASDGRSASKRRAPKRRTRK